MKLSSLLSLIVASFFLVSHAEARTRYLNLTDTMCVKGEAVYISCSLDAGPTPNDYNGPVASVCAKGNTSPDSGYVQYRYGIPGAKAEFTFPRKKLPPRGRLTIYAPAHGQSASLRFRDGEKVYAFEDHGLSGYKLIVTDNGQELINKWCDGPGVNYLIDSAYIGIEQSQSETGP